MQAGQGSARAAASKAAMRLPNAVSYTHLDVYKRQILSYPSLSTGGLAARVALKGAGGGELAQLVANHVRGNVYGNMLAAVSYTHLDVYKRQENFITRPPLTVLDTRLMATTFSCKSKRCVYETGPARP